MLRPGVSPQADTSSLSDANGGQTNGGPNLVALPATPPDISHLAGGDLMESPAPDEEGRAPGWSDPYAATRQQINPEPIFDPVHDQYTGLILGRAIAHRHFRDPESGKAQEVFLIRPGDDVQLMLPTAGNMPTAITHRCTVVDFYHSKMHEYDAHFAFMPLSKLQQIRGMIDPESGVRNVTAIQMKLKPGADLERAKQKLSTFFRPDEPPFLAVQTWMDQQRPLLSAVTMELTILNILLFLIIAVAGFGILATFYMIVVEKTKDIGILKALGASRRGVMGIFLGYGLSLGAVGTGAGIALGLLFVANINRVADVISYCTGREVFDPTMYFFSEIPTVISPLCVMWVALGAVMIAVLASVLPALRAARLNPVEALRYE
jgi:lipoprotein-releasing system permease protein